MTVRPGSVLVDVAKGSVMTLSLFIAYLTFPVLGVVAGFVSPLPVLVYSLAGGWQCGVLIVLISAAGVWGYAGPAAVLFYLLQSGLLAIALSGCIGRGWSMSRAIVYATAVCAAGALLTAVIYSLATGVNPHALILEGIHASARRAVDVYTKSGVTGKDLAALKRAMEQVARLLAVAYPSLLVVFLGAVAGINVLLVRRLGHRWGIALPGSDFAAFRLPEPIVWLVIAAGFSLFVPSEAVHLVSYNLLTVLGALYFIQGLAVVVALFGRFALPAFARYILYLLIGIQPYLIIAVAVLGLFDIWGDFRVPRQKNL